ncbi:MAG: TlpA disulfide reductase family protein, partial [Phycisphaerales bacterium]
MTVRTASFADPSRLAAVAVAVVSVAALAIAPAATAQPMPVPPSPPAAVPDVAADAPAVPAAPAADAPRPVTLKVGDAAPELKIETWIKGEPVKAFEPGSTYVVQFFATWCGPSRQAIPRLTRLSRQFREKGLVVLAISSSDTRGERDVRPFVERMGDRMDYRVAVDNARSTDALWMQAAGMPAIPVAFVVNAAGKIVWIGHPLAGLDAVVEQVVAGVFDADAFARRERELEAMYVQFTDAVMGGKFEEALKVLDRCKALAPGMSAQFDYQRLGLMFQEMGDIEGALKLGEALVAGDFRDDEVMLVQLAQALTSDPRKARAGAALGLKAAVRAAELSQGKDPGVLLVKAEMQFLTRDVDGAIATAEGVLATATTQQDREFIDGVLARYRT